MSCLSFRTRNDKSLLAVGMETLTNLLREYLLILGGAQSFRDDKIKYKIMIQKNHLFCLLFLLGTVFGFSQTSDALLENPTKKNTIKIKFKK